MNILENSLVVKYFGCGCKAEKTNCPERMAYRVLQAMQEPIRKGEKFLSLYADGTLNEAMADKDDDKIWHSDLLRLPDQFQTEREPYCSECNQPIPDALTAKVHVAIHGMKIKPETAACCNDKETSCASGCKCVCHEPENGFKFYSHGDEHMINSELFEKLITLNRRKNP